VALDDDDDVALVDPLGTEDEDEDDALVDDVVEDDAVDDVLDAPAVGEELDGLLGIGVQDGVGPALVDPDELGREEVDGAELVGAGRLEDEDDGADGAEEDGRGAGEDEVLPDRGAELDELLEDEPDDEPEPLVVAGRAGITAAVPVA
jgi:hypothetical protein